MRRGVFALTWFLLLSTALSNLYVAAREIQEQFIKLQGTLMDADEAFYLARNFEWDVKQQLSEGKLNLSYWYSRGNVSYGVAGTSCVQVDAPLEVFINKTFKDGHFQGYGFAPACITFEVHYKTFKTLGVLKSPKCLNASSPLLFCFQ